MRIKAKRTLFKKLRKKCENPIKNAKILRKFLTLARQNILRYRYPPNAPAVKICHFFGEKLLKCQMSNVKNLDMTNVQVFEMSDVKILNVKCHFF
jgi:hypothetical protein